MSAERPPRDRVPVLTEVIEVRAPTPTTAQATGRSVPSVAARLTTDGSLSDGTLDAALPGPAAGSGRTAPEPPAAADAQRPQARLRTEALVRHIELQLEARLREALAPALARAADTLIREARADVAAVVREVVDEAVERELGAPGHDWHEGA